MRPISEILEERSMNLNNTQKGIIASMAVAPTEEMAYGVLTGARNAVSERRTLQRGGFIEVDDDNKRARLTSSGRDVLTSENLMNDDGTLTDRGEELVAKYRGDKDEWKRFESFKYFGKLSF